MERMIPATNFGPLLTASTISTSSSFCSMGDTKLFSNSSLSSFTAIGKTLSSDRIIHSRGNCSTARRRKAAEFCDSSSSKYEALETIASGAFGKIVRIRRRSDGNDTDLVWKELYYGSMSSSDKQQTVSEVNILRKLQNHPHIVKCHDSFIHENSRRLFIVMERCHRGDLAQVIESYRSTGMHNERSVFIDEQYIWKLLGQISSALQCCHMNRDFKTGEHKPILHRDLKPANVLLDKKGNAKLADFGLATDECLPVVQNNKHIFNNDDAALTMGTPFYMSPERINNSAYDERSDVWSLGCIIYELMSLCPPFVADNEHELRVKVNSGILQPLPSCYTEQLQRTCAWMLRHDVSRRPQVNDIQRLPELKTTLRGIRFKLREDYLIRKHTKLQKDISRRRDCMLARESELRSREARIAQMEEDLRMREEALVSRELSRRGDFVRASMRSRRCYENRKQSQPFDIVPLSEEYGEGVSENTHSYPVGSWSTKHPRSPQSTVLYDCNAYDRITDYSIDTKQPVSKYRLSVSNDACFDINDVQGKRRRKSAPFSQLENVQFDSRTESPAPCKRYRTEYWTG